ncbi:retrotransposon protein, putative, ty1-copia subclass, partial [Tanacetum coccineum]
MEQIESLVDVLEIDLMCRRRGGRVRGQPRRSGIDGGGGEEEPQPHRRDQRDLEIAAQGRRIRELERLLAAAKVDVHRDFNRDGDRVCSSDDGNDGGFDTDSASNEEDVNPWGANRHHRDHGLFLLLHLPILSTCAVDDTCHNCKVVGHCKRNCHAYLAELIKKKKQVGTASSSDLKQVEAIGSFDLVLPNGLVICLDNCRYAHSITRGVVSVHRFVENGFVQCFTDFRISVSKNNVYYFNAIPSNGIYEIDMHDLVPNNNSIYNISTKRAKRNLDSTYLWHCRLAHISKKCIEKLQQEGILRSTDDESFDQCVSCLSGKMTRKSFPHRPERATDLLGILHTDVCGPLRHVSRQGASYFITFTDDYSRYGYVYLIKHKHEVFETFKVFKNEVENQLGKTIKAIRSDRGGEYISLEFKDYLKANGIVQQLTPPYTPQ